MVLSLYWTLNPLGGAVLVHILPIMHLHTRNILWSLTRGIYVIRLFLSSWVRLWERFKHSLTKVLVQLSSGLPLRDEWQPARHLTSPKNFTSAVRMWIGTVKSPSPVVGASVHWKILPTLLLIFRHHVLVSHIVFLILYRLSIVIPTHQKYPLMIQRPFINISSSFPCWVWLWECSHLPLTIDCLVKSLQNISIGPKGVKAATRKCWSCPFSRCGSFCSRKALPTILLYYSNCNTRLIDTLCTLRVCTRKSCALFVVYNDSGYFI